jgi:hypothetical protein
LVWKSESKKIAESPACKIKIGKYFFLKLRTQIKNASYKIHAILLNMHAATEAHESARAFQSNNTHNFITTYNSGESNRGKN